MYRFPLIISITFMGFVLKIVLQLCAARTPSKFPSKDKDSSDGSDKGQLTGQLTIPTHAGELVTQRSDVVTETLDGRAERTTEQSGKMEGGDDQDESHRVPEFMLEGGEADISSIKRVSNGMESQSDQNTERVNVYRYSMDKNTDGEPGSIKSERVPKQRRIKLEKDDNDIIDKEDINLDFRSESGRSYSQSGSG